jgi:hypothetical protein
MNPIRGKAEEHGQITGRPDDVTSASLHKVFSNCR